jgi:hypothetical protein
MEKKEEDKILKEGGKKEDEEILKERGKKEEIGRIDCFGELLQGHCCCWELWAQGS